MPQQAQHTVRQTKSYPFQYHAAPSLFLIPRIILKKAGNVARLVPKLNLIETFQAA